MERFHAFMTGREFAFSEFTIGLLLTVAGLCEHYWVMPENIAEAPVWDDQFEALLRQFLPFLSPGEALSGDTQLRDLGLDSMGAVELLANLESTYQTRFRDDALNLQNFASPGVLWSTLNRMLLPSV
ncbi:acyl carrier protein [Rhizomonospora bruguierae]|uniref:acyl carrier protein n=1 Tax=Rhizomonospora bruguierae TaxID=1581705 RepID=UPI0020C12A7A|nr:acyl carrier protein [Micromonospora sp. NBRC 107566]